jgi:hypothetical protein
MPASTRAWVASRRDRAAKLQEEFAEWVDSLKSFQEMAEQYIYSRENPDSLDLRFHMHGLTGLISDAQDLILETTVLRRDSAVALDFLESEIRTLDAHVRELLATLNRWHGTIDSQTDVPASLKQAFAELDAGEVIPFPEQ